MIDIKHDPEKALNAKKGFRQLFDDYFETLAYKEQMMRFPDYLHSEMDAVDGRVEHPTSQQTILTEVLRDSEMLTNFWDALSHLKNEKTMLKISQSPEYQKLVTFLNGFLDINDA